MRRILFVLPIAFASCEIPEDEPIVLECSGPEPGLYVGQTVRLDARIADRPPGQFPEQYSWTLTAVPTGANVLLDRADERDPTFVPDTAGVYTAQVGVVDFDGTDGGTCEVSYEVAPEPVPCGDGTFSNEYQAGECPPELVLFVVTGTFGYDADRESAVPYVGADGSDVPVTVFVEVLNGNLATLCEMALTVDREVPGASWVGDLPDTAYFGFSMPTDAAVDTDCDEAGLDPAIFTDTPSTYLQQLGFGLAVAEMPEDLASDLKAFIVGDTSQQVWDEQWVGKVVGAGVRIDGFSENRDSGWYNVDYGLAYKYDADGSVAFDDANDNGTFDEDDQPVRVASGVPLPEAAYEFFGGYLLDARCGYDPLLCQ